MASRSHHVACVTDDPEAVVSFLEEIVGLEVTGRLVAPGDATAAILGWPENDGTEGWMLGKGPGGLVEVIRIPDELRDQVTPGFALISFAAHDVEDIVERCRERGVTVADPVHTPSLGLTGTVATVGGLAFELLRFEHPTEGNGAS